MATRVGLGPVFAVEWRMASRRWQGYALRSLTVLPLLGAVTLVWSESSAARGASAGGATIQQLAEVGETFYAVTSIILLGLVGLAAPAATAGAICQDKARGNLTLVFATDLSDPEIVLGKLAARLMPVVGMALCAAPVLALSTLFGGIDPVLLAGALMVILSCGVFGCSLALTLSVWGKKTHEVLMATYVLGIVYLLIAPIRVALQAALPGSWLWGWVPSTWGLLRYNPIFLVIAAVDGPPPPLPQVTIGAQAAFLGLGLAASAALLLVATWRIRRVVLDQLGRAGVEARPGFVRRWAGPLRRAFPGPALDANPVLWRECRRRGASGWTLAIWGAYVLFCGGFAGYAIAETFAGRDVGHDLGIWINCVQVGAGLLLFSASASTSLAEERQRGSLDVLMTTPLSTRSIVWGKWWGAYRGVGRLLILPTAVGLSLASWTGRYGGVPLLLLLIAAYAAAITSLGLALATWIPRVGRASAATVGVYVFMCVGWIPLSFLLFGDGRGEIGVGVASASPLMGVGAYSSLIASGGPILEFATETIWILFWIVVYAGVALALLLATLATFNRCLGRVDPPTLFGDGGDPTGD